MQIHKWKVHQLLKPYTSCTTWLDHLLFSSNLLTLYWCWCTLHSTDFEQRGLTESDVYRGRHCATFYSCISEQWRRLWSNPSCWTPLDTQWTWDNIFLSHFSKGCLSFQTVRCDKCHQGNELRGPFLWEQHLQLSKHLPQLICTHTHSLWESHFPAPYTFYNQGLGGWEWLCCLYLCYHIFRELKDWLCWQRKHR